MSKLKSRSAKLVESIRLFRLRNTINEASLSRIWQHIQAGRAFAMITAFRGENTELVDQKNGIRSERKNRALNKDMAKAVRAAGYGFFPIEGHYPEKTLSNREVDRKEESFFIIDDKDDPKTFSKFVEQLGIEFGQDSVFFMDADGQAYFIYTRDTDDHFKGQREKIGNELLTNPNNKKLTQFFSKVKGRTFGFDAYPEG